MADPNNPIVLTPEQVQKVEELAAVLTTTQISDYLAISRSTFNKIRREQPEVDEAWRRGHASSIFEVGSNLISKATSGDVGAMCFYLKTRGGWKENHDDEKKADTPKIEVSIVDAVKKTDES